MEPTRFGSRDRGRGRGGIEEVCVCSADTSAVAVALALAIIAIPIILSLLFSGRVLTRVGVLFRGALGYRGLVTLGRGMDDGLLILDVTGNGFGKGCLLVLALVNEDSAPMPLRFLDT